MTAYGAVFSLTNSMNNILRCSRFSLCDGSQQIMLVVYHKLEPLKNILEILDDTSASRCRKKVNALDGRIKEAIWKFEDSLESLLTLQIPSHLETIPEIVSIDLQSLENDVHSLYQSLDDIVNEYFHQVKNMPQDEPVSSIIGFRGNNSKMIGLSDQFQQVKSDLIRMLGYPSWKYVYALYGTAGVGKTTLAMKIYQDPEIQSIYECHAWVTVGRVPQPITQISRGILAQLCGISGQGDEEIGVCLKERLYGKKCLIVLDDVWETPVRFLNEEESMDLLCKKVFGDESCPPQLHKVATEIAKLCEGLPLMIVTVADSLSKSQNRDPVYWNEVAKKRNSVFTDAYDEISKVLFPSYNYLPQSLKMPFLFMGVFPQDYDTPPSKIITMLNAEGLLPAYDWGNFCLRELAVFYSLVLCSFKSMNKTSDELSFSEYKTCRLHSTWRHVCRVEASKNKFYHVLNKLIDASEESLKGQRGLCLENNILFGIKEFRDSVRLNCALSTHSLLFYGPYHQYPIPIDIGFRLLREIDAVTQRFYAFPIEILSLVQLKYLALTCNGDLPPTISKLFNLRVLIIHPHLNIRRCRAPSYIPIQIWDMQELEHIEIVGKSLVAPSHVASLNKLSTLVAVNASICTILKLSGRIPNIKKLGIRIELTPYDDMQNDLLSCFDCVSTLGSLETLKISITNPVVKYSHVLPVTPGSLKFPRNLRKLHLSGLGFPWEHMDAIGCLPLLEVLKLRSYAFQGSHWETQRESFRSLRFLLIEESDLVQWKPRYGSFPELKYLSMRHCYKLKGIQRPASLYLTGNRTVEIEMVDCNPLALTCASQLQPSIGVRLRVLASSSFYEKPTTTIFERFGRKYIPEVES
ncbi:putative late blight resistance protein homolog R1A-10 [Salvia hispanica]|uniref:putative late blight resistance protein homolog R1A-10 n=1 Tax=Salvia hispanica TaxID=49212 RepID=UPI002009CD2A|nr:putative late blight resistance protein homolog R1A-10 [Salvia hispanica]